METKLFILDVSTATDTVAQRPEPLNDGSNEFDLKPDEQGSNKIHYMTSFLQNCIDVCEDKTSVGVMSVAEGNYKFSGFGNKHSNPLSKVHTTSTDKEFKLMSSIKEGINLLSKAGGTKSIVVFTACRFSDISQITKEGVQALRLGNVKVTVVAFGFGGSTNHYLTLSKAIEKSPAWEVMYAFDIAEYNGSFRHSPTLDKLMTKPIKPVAKPTEQMAKPTEQATKPTEQATKPTEQATKPTESKTASKGENEDLSDISDSEPEQYVEKVIEKAKKIIS